MVNAGKLKLTCMSEEEQAAYRLREPPDAGADLDLEGFLTRNPDRRHVAHPGATRQSNPALRLARRSSRRRSSGRNARVVDGQFPATYDVHRPSKRQHAEAVADEPCP